MTPHKTRPLSSRWFPIFSASLIVLSSMSVACSGTESALFDINTSRYGAFTFDADRCFDRNSVSGWSRVVFTSEKRPGVIIMAEGKESSTTQEILVSSPATGVINVIFVDEQLRPNLQFSRESCNVFEVKREHVPTSVKVNGVRVWRDDVSIKLDCTSASQESIKATISWNGYCR